jgi:SAM-dependent methyltransferase
MILTQLSETLERYFGSPAAKCSLLDLGAGTGPYAPLYEQYFAETVSVDVPYSPHDISHIDVTASADSLPFESETFDFVLCTEVLEHCREPGTVVTEISRVLKPGGYAFVTTPFMAGLHEVPHDYFRFTRFGLQALAEDADLTVEAIWPKGGYGALVLLSVQYPLTKVFQVAQSKTGLPLYHPANPLLYGFVVLPQLAYVWRWRKLGGYRKQMIEGIPERLSRMTLGYMILLTKRS